MCSVSANTHPLCSHQTYVAVTVSANPHALCSHTRLMWQAYSPCRNKLHVYKYEINIKNLNLKTIQDLAISDTAN